MEVTCGLKVVEVFEALCNAQVGFKTLFDLAFPLELLTLNKLVLQVDQIRGGGGHWVAHAFVQLELLLELGRRLDPRGRLNVWMRQVKEVNISLHVPISQQLVTHGFRVNLLVQHELLLLVVHLVLARGSVRPLCCRLARQLVQGVLFCAGNKLVLLLLFRFLDNGVNLGVWVVNWL